MNPVDSDLEEGEIVDDLPSLTYSNKEHRELPRRYVFHEKGSPIHKHKRDCKHAIHGHFKKFTPLKKTQRSKNYHKRHRKSACSREKYHKPPGKNTISTKKNFSKKDHSVSGLSLLSEIKKESLKENSILKQSTKILPKSEKDISEAEKNKTDNFKSEIGKVNADTQSENSSVKESRHQSLVSNTKDLSNLRNINPESDLKVSCSDASNNFSKVEHEESEDEEELRRIALATCAKRKAAMESSKNSFQTVESRDAVSVPESSEVRNVQTLHQEVTSPSDNYEVVDMEVDEDIEASIEVLAKSERDQNAESTENLFVIDTKPTADSKDGEKQNASSELKAIQNNSDDDFETDVLRAELIQSLYRKKSMQDECGGEDKLNISVHKKQASTLPKKKHVGKYKRSNFNFYRRNLKPGKHIIRKTIINKPAEVLSCNSSKPPSPIPVNKPPERLVIALNGSSSEDSADSESENPVASIEALISDCRQKSDSNEKPQETVTNVPKAVSCLSKAQQEEYTSLLKILAEKKKPQEHSDAFEHKNGSAHSLLDDLKLLEKKLLGFEENLKEKKDLEAYLLKDMSSKKLLYLKSKLTAHHLKEQYLAAEKIRKANLCTWSKSCSDLKNVQKSVSNLENKIIQLQDLCSRLGASVQGQTFDLPSLSIGNRQS